MKNILPEPTFSVLRNLDVLIMFGLIYCGFVLNCCRLKTNYFTCEVHVLDFPEDPNFFSALVSKIKLLLDFIGHVFFLQKKLVFKELMGKSFFI